MGTSLTHPTQSAHATEPQEQLQRLRELTSEQMTAGLRWLSGYASAVFEAVLDAVQPCAGDPAPDGNSEPGPFCGHCGSAIGIFLRFGLDWRHYKEDRSEGAAFGPIELFDPGHAPEVAWRLPQDATVSR